MMGVLKSAAKDFTIDIGFLIESQAVDELPEMMLGTVRLSKCVRACVCAFVRACLCLCLCVRVGGVCGL